MAINHHDRLVRISVSGFEQGNTTETVFLSLAGYDGGVIVTATLQPKHTGHKLT